MEKRIGVVAILITDKNCVNRVNLLLSDYGRIIIARQGIPLHERRIHVISLIVEGTTDEISALTGKLGKIEGLEVKSLLTKFKETEIV